VLLDFGRKAEQSWNLCYPGAGDPLMPGDACLVEGLTGVEEGLPLDGLAEELDHAGRLGLLCRLGPTSAGRDRAHDTVGGHPVRQGADVAVRGRPLVPKRNLDRLFAVGADRPAITAVRGDV